MKKTLSCRETSQKSLSCAVLDMLLFLIILFSRPPWEPVCIELQDWYDLIEELEGDMKVCVRSIASHVPLAHITQGAQAKLVRVLRDDFLDGGIEDIYKDEVCPLCSVCVGLIRPYQGQETAASS